MLYLAALVAATLGLFFGAYRLGRRSDAWSVVLATILLCIAWYALVDLTQIGQGEGAAAGVVVIQAGIWYVGTTSALLALILLVTSVYVRRSAVTSVALVCAIAALFTLGFHLTDRTSESAASGLPSEHAVEPHDSDLEGYAWAIDNGIQAEAECINGTPAFIDGCKRAVRRRNESATPPVQGR